MGDGSSDDIPLASRVTPAGVARLSRAAKVWLILLFGIAAGAVLLQVQLFRFSYRLGLTNSGGPADGFFRAVPLATTWVVLALAQFGALAVFLSRRPRPRAVWLVIAVSVAAIGPVNCVTGRILQLGGTYEDGFGEWVRTHIDDNSIRSWAANQPAVTAPVVVPSSAWPTSISACRPAGVEQHPGNGIVVQWGVLASWGTSRKVFVAPDALAAPPADALHPWILVRPGLWMGVQITN